MDNNLSRAQDLAKKILGNSLTLQQQSSNGPIQIQKQGSLIRLEKVFTNISDNVYNIGGVFNAQLTSMEETRKGLREKYNKQKLSRQELNLERRSFIQSSSKQYQQSLDAKLDSLDDLLKSLQSLIDAAHSGYDLFDYDRKNRNNRKTNRKNSKAKIKAKFDPIIDFGKKFLKKAPLIGAILTVGEGLYKTLEEDDEVTESRGGPLASFAYNTADSLIENLTFGLVDMKAIQETGKVLSGSEEGKRIAEKNRQAIQGIPSSELDFMMGGVSYQEDNQPTLVKTRSLTVTETSEERLKRLGITPSAIQGGRGKYKPANVTPEDEDENKSISLDELIAQKKAQHDKNIITTSDGSVLVDSQGNPVRSGSLDDLIEEVVKKETAPTPVTPTAPTPVTPTAPKPVTPSAVTPTKPPQPVSKPMPSGPSGIVETIINSLKQAGITSLTAISNILSQIKSESNFRLSSENMYYTDASKIQQALGKRRFPTLESAEPYVRNPEALGNYAYRTTDGNSEPGDGYKYRGRGWVQHTGKNQYAALSKYLGVDLLTNPDLLNDPVLATKALLWFFLSYKRLKPSDLEDSNKVSKAVGFQDTSGTKIVARANEAELIKSKLTSGQDINEVSASIAGVKKQNNSGQTVINVNNSNNSAVRMGPPNGGPTISPRPVMI